MRTGWRFKLDGLRSDSGRLASDRRDHPVYRAAVSEWKSFGVLLVRASGLDGSFEYVGPRLPAVGDEIELTHPFVGHSLDASPTTRAKVTGVEPDKTRPIRAVEL